MTDPTPDLTPARHRLRLARVTVGIAALITSYICLFFLPVLVLTALRAAVGAGMSADPEEGNPAIQLVRLPLIIGVVSWLIALLGGPGLVIRLMCVPCSLGYLAILYFISRIS